ncbi:hypothetical protein D9M71_506050 [compost metagenome]
MVQAVLAVAYHVYAEVAGVALGDADDAAQPAFVALFLSFPDAVADQQGHDVVRGHGGNSVQPDGRRPDAALASGLEAYCAFRWGALWTMV